MSDTAPYRIAFRTEGDRINAYLATTDTMEGSVWLGALRHSVAEGSPATWEKFKAAMCQAISDASAETTGVRPIVFDEEPAPEHERAGRG